MNIQYYIDDDVCVTIWTDGASSNNALSMMTKMRLAALSGKNIANSPQVAKANDIY